ncbi:hypothetical protein MTO96_052112 [Rhipicephalus appendiculatus]
MHQLLTQVRDLTSVLDRSGLGQRLRGGPRTKLLLLEGLSFEVRGEEILAIIATSEQEGSALLDILANQHPKWGSQLRGDIMFNGLFVPPARLEDCVVYVARNWHLWPDMSVRQWMIFTSLLQEDLEGIPRPDLRRSDRAPLAAELSDICRVDGAFKLLSSTDPEDRERAREEPDRLYDQGARITCGEATVSSVNRKKLVKTFRAILNQGRARSLQEKPSQGKAMACVAADPANSHFMRSGRYTRFKEWRFIHRARLNSPPPPLNGTRTWVPAADKRCRRCGYGEETLAHALCRCMRQSRATTERHNAIVARLKAAALGLYTIIGENQQVGVPGLRPDLVLARGDEALILDVCCPFDNRMQAFQEARRIQEGKYAPFQLHLLRGFQRVSVDAIVVGCPGTWDPANNHVCRSNDSVIRDPPAAACRLLGPAALDFLQLVVCRQPRKQLGQLLPYYRDSHRQGPDHDQPDRSCSTCEGHVYADDKAINTRQPKLMAPQRCKPGQHRSEHDESLHLRTYEDAACLRKCENTAPGGDRITYLHWRDTDPDAYFLSAAFNMCLRLKRVPPRLEGDTNDSRS